MEQMDHLRGAANGNIQNAPNVFQWAVVDGLVRNAVDFMAVSCPFLPSAPMNYKEWHAPAADIVYEGVRIGHSLPYDTFALVKPVSVRKKLIRYVEAWVDEMRSDDEKLVVLIYSVYSPFLKVLEWVKRRYPDVVTASIVTDLPDDMMAFYVNRTPLKRIQCALEARNIKKSYRYIDKFFLLSSPMTERIPEASGRNCVVEGIAVAGDFPQKQSAGARKILLYTGSLDEFSGVRALVNAFMETADKDYMLMICGDGMLRDYINESAAKDERIVYKGMVSREEAVRLQKDATALINPRRPDEGITKYSFPSKTMEYLISGTPMIGYRLKGIPEEYYGHYYVIDDQSENALTDTIDRVLSLPEAELAEKAAGAYEFIMKNKTSDKQVRKMIDFLAD